MTDRVCLLTGSTAGIGREAARQLTRRGLTVVCVARDEGKARDLVAELERDGGRASYLIGDLTRPAEVARVADEFRERHDRLDVLFNNAGALFVERRLTEDGLERTFALNHLSYFVLTVRLLDRLKGSAPARVVSTSSAAHGRGELGYLDDLQGERRWSPSGMRAYGNSKLANIWFTRELGRRLEGTGVTAHCFHPGFVASDFARNNGALATAAMIVSRPFQRSVERGADTGVWLATSEEASGTGGYWFDRRRRKGSRAARDEAAPTRLWAESERIVASVLGEGWGAPPDA